jgi:hypothetical protein
MFLRHGVQNKTICDYLDATFININSNMLVALISKAEVTNSFFTVTYNIQAACFVSESQPGTKPKGEVGRLALSPFCSTPCYVKEDGAVQINYSIEFALLLLIKKAFHNNLSDNCVINCLSEANPCGRAVKVVGLRQSACWECGFESRRGRGHGCLSLVNVVCCQTYFSASGCSLVKRSPTGCVCITE